MSFTFMIYAPPQKKNKNKLKAKQKWTKSQITSISDLNFLIVLHLMKGGNCSDIQENGLDVKKPSWHFSCSPDSQRKLSRMFAANLRLLNSCTSLTFLQLSKIVWKHICVHTSFHHNWSAHTENTCTQTQTYTNRQTHTHAKLLMEWQNWSSNRALNYCKWSQCWTTPHGNVMVRTYLRHW